LPVKTCLQNNLLSVEQDAKLLMHSLVDLWSYVIVEEIWWCRLYVCTLSLTLKFVGDMAATF